MLLSVIHCCQTATAWWKKRPLALIMLKTFWQCAVPNPDYIRLINFTSSTLKRQDIKLSFRRSLAQFINPQVCTREGGVEKQTLWLWAGEAPSALQTKQLFILAVLVTVHWAWLSTRSRPLFLGWSGQRQGKHMSSALAGSLVSLC